MIFQTHVKVTCRRDCEGRFFVIWKMFLNVLMDFSLRVGILGFDALHMVR